MIFFLFRVRLQTKPAAVPSSLENDCGIILLIVICPQVLDPLEL